ncbi:hypothetical protein CAPTEDRAFT_189303 [Capitella teleta]|uniref:Fibronectin type-III domain-containing protein n=1 Tax=Capitella teleta TaxID=283909 RepID=R7UKQ0_CAPTE|nr:hypothetical protein CAPTEDRAFT_189303 [Capitella teleta]|eukprot:ELU06668.1 hypothetical protein CAPTEDRAFT_189303 [Capitella teleta]
MSFPAGKLMTVYSWTCCPNTHVNTEVSLILFPINTFIIMYYMYTMPQYGYTGRHFKVAGNAAYILGTIAESESGALRVISLTNSMHRESKGILMDLTNMLLFDDSESVMNAAGTMGTLAESFEGRNWMLQEPCLVTTIQNITGLLISDNLWTASNAALVLARITIAEEGCQKILDHPDSENILFRLVASLGVDEAGRGMNAAFAIGRLCDMEAGRSRLLALPESEKMITSLAKMLSCTDPGASKNSCFALSCLATSNDGHRRLLKNSNSEEVLWTLSELLSADDSETGWFSAMTLKTLASQIKGCLRLRDHPNVLPSLRAADARPNINSDLREEVTQTLEILKKLSKPRPPDVEVCGHDEVEISWEKQTTKLNLLVKYHVFQDGGMIYDGSDDRLPVKNLAPAHQYAFRTRAYAEGDDGILSDATLITTEESVPGPPTNVRILGATTTQLKIGWDVPFECNGVLKNYFIYNGDKYHESTSELTSIISGLQPNTSYEICVAASTAKGKGPKESISAATVEMGAHAPSKPEVNVRGRNEMNVSWKAPVVPLGRISRYEVCMNGEAIYSGMDLHYTARRLKPDTEYTFTVSAITSEGKCESKTTKKRSAKDEYEVERAPLYQNPNKKESEQKSDEKKEETPAKAPRKRKPVSVPQDAQPKSPVCKNNTMFRKVCVLIDDRSLQCAVEARTPTPSTKHPPVLPQKRTPSAGPRYKFGYSHSGSVKLSNVRTEESKTTTEPKSSPPPPPPPALLVRFRCHIFCEMSEYEAAQEFCRIFQYAVVRKEASLVNFFVDNYRKFQRPNQDPSQPASVHCVESRLTIASAKTPKGRKSEPCEPVSSVKHSEPRKPKLLAPIASASSWDYSMCPPFSPQETKAVTTKTAKKSEPDETKGVEGKPLIQSRPKPSSRRNSKSVAENAEPQRRKTHRRQSSSNNLEKPAPQLASIKTYQGNDILSVEIDKRLRVNHDSASGGAPSESSYIPAESKLLPRRGSVRSHLSADSVESDTSSLSPVTRQAENGTPLDTVTRTFSTLQSANAFKPSASQFVKPGFIEFEGSSSLPANLPLGPPTHVQRANTFIASHRPNHRRQSIERRSSASSLIAIQNTNTSEWKPDIPSSVKTDRAYSKFVPMQFRTQPANLPRQSSQPASDQRSPPQFEPLGVFARSRTDMRPFSPLDHRAPPPSPHVTPFPQKKPLSANHGAVRSNMAIGANSLQSVNGDHLVLSPSRDPYYELVPNFWSAEIEDLFC